MYGYPHSNAPLGLLALKIFVFSIAGGIKLHVIQGNRIYHMTSRLEVK